jgi:hypothetical protein
LERWIVAYHESGHALILITHGTPFPYVSIEAHGTSRGRVASWNDPEFGYVPAPTEDVTPGTQDNTPLSDDTIRYLVNYAAAGMAAVRAVFGSASDPATAQSDWEDARRRIDAVPADRRADVFNVPVDRWVLPDTPPDSEIVWWSVIRDLAEWFKQPQQFRQLVALALALTTSGRLSGDEAEAVAKEAIGG